MTENSRDELEESFDNETGEKKTKTIYCNIQRVNTDAETGEPELFDVIVKRKTFQVPVKYLEQPLENRGFKQKTRRKIVSEFHFQKKKNQKGIVKAVFLSDKPNVGPFVFMLPTLLIFPAWASILCLLWEAFMHIWSHKR